MNVIRDPAEVSGPVSNGSRSLARESRFGLAWSFVLLAGTDAAINALTSLDTSSWQGWWVRVAEAGVATAIGLLVAYRTRNRNRVPVRRSADY